MLNSSPNVERVSSTISGYMPVLNGYRGVAILLVFLHHCVSDLAGEHAESINAVYRDLMNSLWCGVDAFFVLSGFLIAGILLDSREKPNYFQNFYARRILRIFPLYYVFLIIFLGVIHPLIRSYEYPNHMDDIQIWYWFYLENWQWIYEGVFLTRPIDHLWSLAIEEQFYLICPAVVYFLPRRLLSWFLGIVILSVIVFRSWLVLTHPLSYTLSSSIYVNSLCRVDALAIGCLTALWMRSDKILHRLLSISPILTILSGLSLSIIIITQGGFNKFNPVLLSIGFSVIAIFCSSLIILSVSQSENSPLVRCLSWSPLQGLGTVSYGFYVYHFPILWMLCDRIYEYVGHSFILGHIASFFSCGVLTLVISIGSWFYLEKPILKLKSYFPSQPEEKFISGVANSESEISNA
ncbi:MAG: acyltransferase [Nostocaceae cyanobacterium]|nr:acyltransferase [Nostocaceae cyanobacterium]